MANQTANRVAGGAFLKHFLESGRSHEINLQCPFFQNSEFHRTIEELTIWLEETTATIRSTEPVDLSQPQSILESKYSKFVQLHSDLQRCEPRIVSLQVNLPLIVMFHSQTNNNLSQSIYLGGRRSAGTSNGKPAMW